MVTQERENKEKRAVKISETKWQNFHQINVRYQTTDAEISENINHDKSQKILCLSISFSKSRKSKIKNNIFLKSQGEKNETKQNTLSIEEQRIVGNFSQTMQVRRMQNKIFKALRENKWWASNSVLWTIIFPKCRRNNFSDKHKIKNFVTSKCALQDIKDFLQKC